MKWNLITKKLQALGLTLALLTSGTLMTFATEEAIEEPNLTAAEESLEEAALSPTQIESETENKKIVLFSDTASNAWYYDTVVSMAGKGVINGYPNGTFKPNGTITRAEFIKICVSMFAEEEIPAPLFGQMWYQPYVDQAIKDKIIPNGMEVYSLDECTANITREEMASVIELCSQIYLWEGSEDFETGSKMLAKIKAEKMLDYESISAVYRDFVESAFAKGFVNGMTDTTFVPKGTATRAQAATMIERLTETDKRLDNLSNLSLDTNPNAIKYNKNGGTVKELDLPDYGYAQDVRYTVMSPAEFNEKNPITSSTYGTDARCRHIMFAYKEHYFSALGVSVNGVTDGWSGNTGRDVLVLD